MKKGLTLVEMLVAITITAIILGITVTQFIMQRKHIDMQETQIKLDRETRLSLVFIANELRELGLDPKRTHSFGITNGDPISISYLTDRDVDGIVDAADNGTITVVGDTLRFNNQFIIDKVSHLWFTYVNNDPLPGDTVVVFPVNEDSGGYFYPSISAIRVRLMTEITEGTRLVAQSDQRIEVEMKNR